MKWIVILWASPLALFWGWYFLSLNDVNFGYIMLSRQAHDLIFELYGQILGIDPKTIPMLIAQACVLDSLVIGAIYAFRRRKEIVAWYHSFKVRDLGDRISPEVGQAPPAE